MGYETSPLLRKSAIVLVVVAAVATLLNLFFAQLLHREPLGLLGFGLFCIFYSTLLSYLSRQSEARQPPSAPESNPDFPSPARPVVLRDERVPMRLTAEFTLRSTHALTVDLEDYFHTEVASQGLSMAEWEQQPSRIEASTHRLLDLLERNQTRATFFVLGWVALRYRSLIQEIHQRGHEIGCHSMDHQLVCRMSPKDFYESTRTAKNLIESITQEEVLGYRAPCFSMIPGCDWAFDALARLGFRYDSSVHPIAHPVYGNPTAPRLPYPVAQGRMIEFPIATWKIAGRNMPIGGGAYLRLLPYQYVHQGLLAWEKTGNGPAMFYLHPWEIDPYQPFIPLSLRSTIRQTWGTTTMEHKLQRLLHAYRFAPVREVHETLLAGQGVLTHETVFQPSEPAVQVAG